MRKYLKLLYVFCMYFLFVIVLAHQFLSIPPGLYVTISSAGLILFLLSTLWRNRGFMQVASIAALVLGHMLLFGYGLGFEAWYTSLTKAIALPMLFVVIPLITVPINNGGYLESIGDFVVTHRHHSGSVFFILTLISFALAIALNIASIIIFQRLLDPLNLPRKYLARLYMVVYGSNMIFSPYDPILNMILLYQSVSYADYLFSGLALVIAIAITGLFLILLDKPMLQDLKKSLPQASGEHSMRKLGELMGHVLTLIFFAFMGSYLMPETPTIFIVTGIIVVYSMIWILILRVFNALKDELRRYNENFEDYVQFLPFIIALSFFGSAMSMTPIRVHIAEALIYLNGLPDYFVVLGCMSLVAVLSLCGIYMIIPITTLALTVTPATIGFTPEAFIALLMASWVSGMIISPLIPFTVVTSSAIQVKPTTLAYRWGPSMLLPWLFIAPAVVAGINYLSH